MLQALGELGQHLVQVTDNTEVGVGEDRRVLVPVDRDDDLGVVDADHVLHLTGDADGQVEVGLDRGSRHPQVPLGRHPADALGDRTAARQFGAKLGRAFAVNIGLAVGLAALGYWWLYPLLWIVPLLTWHMLVTRLRNIAEHAMVEDADPWRIARTTHANWLGRAFIAPYYVNYHAEHHIMLYVPCYRLPLMHQLLDAKGLKPKLETLPGYAAVLRMAAPA